MQKKIILQLPPPPPPPLFPSKFPTRFNAVGASEAMSEAHRPSNESGISSVNVFLSEIARAKILIL